MRYSLVIGALILGIGAFIFAFSALGQEGTISFPVAELGDCASKDECRTYCDDPAHTEQCLDFAVRNGFMSAEDAARAKQFISQTGPGGCKGGECKDYCEDPAHRNECLDFAVEQGFVPAELAQEIKRLPTTGPAGCKGEECREYCDDPDNAEECLNFAVENNLIPAEAAAQARRMLRAIQTGGPGGCTSEEECRQYCENPANEETCFAFAEQNGLIPAEELERARKGREIANKIETEGGPGGCKGEAACKLYCADPENTEECIQFAVGQGFMTTDEARREIERFQRGDFDEYRQRFEEHREQFEEEFRQKKEEFEERFRTQREEFEQRFRQFQESDFPTPGEFPGASGEFPSQGGFPPPQEFPGQTQFPGPSPEEIKRYEDEFRQQYEQYRSQYPDQQNFEQYQPPPLPASSIIQNLPAFILNFFR